MATTALFHIDVDHLIAPGASASGPARLTIADGEIAAVNPISAPLNGFVALPAFANAHDHGRGLRTLAFGAVDDALESWLPSLAREPRLPAFERAALAFARMAETGIAATMHVHGFQAANAQEALAEAAEVARAAEAVGIHVAFAPPFRNRNPHSYGNEAAFLEASDPGLRAALASPPSVWRPTIEDYLGFVDRVAEFAGPCFSVQYCPAGYQWVTDEAIAAIASASARTGRRIHMHLLETRYQREWADFAYPHGALARLDELEFLSPRLSVAHGIYLKPDEQALLADRGVIVSVNTSSNFRLRSGIAPVGEFLDQGLTFGLGLDSLPMDDDDDMLREMRLVYLNHRGFGLDDRLTPTRLLRAATRDGRAAIFGPGDGDKAFHPGAPADIVVLDLGAISGDVLDPSVDPLTIMLTRATRRQVRTLIVGGTLVVDNGSLATLERRDLEVRLNAAARAAWAATPPDDERTRLMRRAVRTFYGCGCHAGGFIADA
ncbi:MAG: amidohydrolase family protein [Ancalomicrobiaceae bacterium]|nr:amidohydrolase family protein [Ancalomicrobiaceae bacterium]